jgi:chemotaxis signal transduction protein
VKDDSSLHERVEFLRRAFDESFTRPFALRSSSAHELLTVICGRERIAVDASELSFVEPRIDFTALPGAPPGCVGVAGVRGKLVVVYELSRLLGYEPVEGAHSVLISREEPSLGFSVQRIERYVRVEDEKIHRIEGAAAEPVYAAARLADGSMPVLSPSRLVYRMQSGVEGARGG